MRILHYIDRLDLKNGGTVTAVMDMAVSIKQLGHEITVLTHGAGAKERWELRQQAVALHVLGSEQLNGVFGPRSTRAADAVLSEVDVAHLHGVWSPALAQLASRARRHHCPYIVTTHGMLSTWAMEQRTFKKVQYWRAVLRRVLEGAAAVHHTAQAEAEQSSRWVGAVRTERIPYVFRPEAYLEATGKPTVPVPTGNRVPTLLYLGRLHPKKGLHVLVPALAQIRAAGVEAQLVVAGHWASARYEKEVMEAIAELGLELCISFLGFVDGREKTDLYACVDLFVLPTSQENFGFVAYESLAAGTPAVITYGVDTWRELTGSGGARVCEQEIGALAAGLRLLLQDDEQLRQMGEQGREWIKETYGGNKVAKTYERLYRDVSR